MKKSIARKFKMGGGLEGGNEMSGVPGKTERSKKIQEGIKNKTDKEKKDILTRNLPAFTFGKLETGGKYRKDMPDQMQNIALRSDSVRAAYHSLTKDSTFKMKGFGGFGEGTSPAKKDKKYDKATMKSVRGDKHDDKQADKMAQMSYTDEYAQESFDNLKSNYTKGKTMGYTKGKDGRENTENAEIVRAYRYQQKNLKKGLDSSGKSIAKKKSKPTKLQKSAEFKPGNQQARQDTVQTYLHQNRYTAADNKKFPISAEIHRKSEKRLKGARITQKQALRQFKK